MLYFVFLVLEGATINDAVCIKKEKVKHKVHYSYSYSSSSVCSLSTSNVWFSSLTVNSPT